jgi:hypothetical protein
VWDARQKLYRLRSRDVLLKRRFLANAHRKKRDLREISPLSLAIDFAT